MNLLPAINRLSIVRKDLQVVRLQRSINWAQVGVLDAVHDQINARRPIRIIVLKARQLGISTLIEALMFLFAMMMQRMRGLVVSHELDSSEHLLGITQHYWDTFPFNPFYTQKYKGAKRLSWVENKSMIQVSTAKNVSSGRSRTIQALHSSEVGFWDDAATLMTGLGQAVPQIPLTMIALESTANGIGNYFHTQWQHAVAGDTAYTPLFFPWYKHPEYVAERLNMPTALIGKLSDEEKVLRAIGITDSQLVWRRYSIANNCQNDILKFHQEYPTTPEEAFIATGTNVFEFTKLLKCYDPRNGRRGRLVREGQRVRFQDDPSGELTLFKLPSKNEDFGYYTAAGDPTHTTRGDYACIQIINRRTWEQVAVWRGRIDPYNFGDRVVELSQYFNNAVAACEITGPGYATIARMMSLNYPYIWKNQWAEKEPGSMKDRYGWESTYKTKAQAVGNLQKVVVDRDVLIHDVQTFTEMKNFVTKKDGGYGNASHEGHDDTVMALAIAITVTMFEAPVLPALGTWQKAGMGMTVIEGGEVKALTTGEKVQAQPDVDNPSWMEWGQT